MKLRILIVDDESRIRQTLSALLQDDGHCVQVAENGEMGIQLASAAVFDLLFLDVKLPGIDGLETLRQIREIATHTAVIMMSGQSDLSVAVQATKLGAHNFLEKPLNPERVMIEVEHVARQLSLEAQVAALESRVGGESEIIGDSLPMRRLKDTIARSAPTDGRILILGENGTGKELVSRSIHRQSRYREGPFVSLNCAAIPENLVESELFGHEKGAFTGADRKKPGRFELADGGTLFLDEVGDMNLDTQAKLLRVLQEGEAVHVGGTHPYRFHVRVIAATNKDLTQAIQQNRFREDLYYRLNVIPIHVPPLRERLQDIPMLANFFLRQSCSRSGREMKQWDDGCLTILQSYAWPGNVRELINFTERMMILSHASVITTQEVSEALPVSSELSSKAAIHPANHFLPFREKIEAYEKQILIQGFHESKGNVSELARLLRMDRANLHRKLKGYGIK